MKSLTEYLTESLSRPRIRFSKLNRVSKFLNKDKLKKDEKEYGTNYDLPMTQKTPDAKFDLLFRILCGRLNENMEFDEILNIISEYFDDIDMGYELPEKGEYAYKSSKDIWDKDIDPRLLIVHFGNPANSILFQIEFQKDKNNIKQ